VIGSKAGPLISNPIDGIGVKLNPPFRIDSSIQDVLEFNLYNIDEERKQLVGQLFLNCQGFINLDNLK
jgi:hypothetical protein